MFPTFHILELACNGIPPMDLYSLQGPLKTLPDVQARRMPARTPKNWRLELYSRGKPAMGISYH